MSGSRAIDVSTEISEAGWNAFVSAHPEATGYHLWGWRRVFERAFGHETVYLVARREWQIVGVLPLVAFRSWLFGRFMVSLPFVNYGGVLATDPEVVEALVNAAAREAAGRGCRHIELRHTSARLSRLPAKQHKVAMTLELPADAAAAWDGLDRKVRNQVRKAQKSDLSSVVGGRELLDDFYEIFAVNMRDLGTPVYGRAFFAQVLEEFPEDTGVHVIRLGPAPVAAGITFAFRRTIEVPWASSLRAHRALCPNNLLYWSIIEQAIADGFRTLDFGRSTPHEGTYEFKRQWGAVPSPLVWEYALVSASELPDQSPGNPKFRSAIELWKRLPVPVATAIGPRIVRSIP
jgi:serine/alanine adding enzyme